MHKLLILCLVLVPLMLVNGSQAIAAQPSRAQLPYRVPKPVGAPLERVGGLVGGFFAWLGRGVKFVVTSILQAVHSPMFRLNAFGITILLLSLSSLAYLGMQSLWVNNPTFGASLTDYFGIFVWGLGANATSTGILTLLKNWGVNTSVTA